MSNYSVQNKSFKRSKPKRVFKGQEGKVALKMVKKLAKEIEEETEVKYLDTEIDMAPYTATPATELINYMAQGLTNITRIGNDINITSLKFRVILDRPQATYSAALGELAPVSIRILLVRDRDGYNATLSPNEILSNTTNDVTRFRNPDYTRRYNILYDNVYILNPELSSAGTSAVFTINGKKMYLEYFKKFKKSLNVKFAAATAISATNDQFWLLAYSDAPVALNAPTIKGIVRLNYTDA